MGNLYIHPHLKELAGVFTAHGKQAFLVGGAVRDIIMGKKPSDWDIATDARPEEIISMFRRVIPTGIKHGTVTILFKGRSIEATTFRTESEYTDGRRPDSVNYAASIEEDLSRRDFTMNALAVSLPQGRLVDAFGGREDIRSRIIRCVGSPDERFSEDGLRPLRAVRFAAKLGFEIEPATLEAIPGALPVTAKVAQERIKDELNKILLSPKPSTALLLMEKTGLLSLIIPELGGCRGIEQKGFHRFDVLDHSLLACDYIARNFSGSDGLELALAALLHDIGKPLTRALDKDGIWTFYRHEKESARLAEELLTRLRYPAAAIKRVVHLIGQHMFFYEENWTDSAVRHFIVRVGRENLDHVYALRRSDTFAQTGTVGGNVSLDALMERVDSVLRKEEAFSLKDLAVKGGDLISAGIKPGKKMGIILDELLETVLDDPSLNTRETLLDIAGKLSKKYGED